MRTFAFSLILALCALTARADAVSILASAGAGGVIAPCGEMAVAEGSDATFVIAASNGFHIADVSINGRSIGPVPVYTFVEVRSNQTIEARFHVPWASRVVSYTAGTNAAAQWRHPQTVLGEPSRRTNYGFADVTMFQPPWMTNQIVSIGSEGELTIEFGHAVTNDPHNPYGIDLLVFGNAMFRKPLDRDIAIGIQEEPGSISVSQDGVVWHEVPGAKADSLFPSLGFTDASRAADEWEADGTQPTSFVLPVDPSISWTNKTYTELVGLYAGSGGGGSIDLADVGLDWIRYVKVWQPPGQSWSTEIDGFADVAPSLSRTLSIASARGQSLPAPGQHTATSGVPVVCSVAQPVVTLGAGARAVCRGWTATGAGGAVSSGAETSKRFTIVEHTAWTWLWETEYWLDIAAEEGGLVSADADWFIEGTTLELTASSSPGYEFLEWSGDTGGADTTAPWLTLAADGPRTVRARFREHTVSPGLTAWLVEHDLTNETFATEAALDRDGDGFSAREEYAAGTDPNDPRSLPRIVAFRAAHGSNTLTWLGGPGGAPVPFTVWTSGTPADGWAVLTSEIAKAADGTNSLTHPVAGEGPLFYRISAPMEEP